MTLPTTLNKWIDFSAHNPTLQQFGQHDDESTFNGATGCTHTVLQRLIKAKTGVYYTHDQISTIAGYPWPAHNPGKRGLYSGGSKDEVGRVVAHFGLPYELKIGLTWGELIPYFARGPVIMGVLYGYWPEDKGYHYGSVVADGRPGGFAYRNGKTQLYGAESIYHAVLVIGRATYLSHLSIFANEPNHGSATRPEHPDYDRVLSSYAHRAYDQYRHLGRKNFAWVPTRAFTPKGY